MRKLYSLVLTLAALITLAGGSANAQTFPQNWYWAANYGQWAIKGQAANTYTFSPASVCQVPAPQNGVFFPFSTNAPVFVQDAVSTANEDLTPSSVINNGSQCGIVVTASNSHYSFYLRSGTGGLQEAINAQSSSATYPALIYLDRNWYAQAAAVPNTTPAAIIAAAVGNSEVYLLDITTNPWTPYKWSGSAYIPFGLSQAGNIAAFNGVKPSSLTLISPPSAPSPTPGTPSGIAAGTYRVAITYVDALGGETLISTDTSSTVTTTSNNGTITIPSPAASAGAVGWRAYVSAAAGATGSEILYAPSAAGCTVSAKVTAVSACAIGSNAVFSALVTGTGTIPAQATAHATAAATFDTVPHAFQTVYGPFAALVCVCVVRHFNPSVMRSVRSLKRHSEVEHGLIQPGP
jgi:hypothetical protein